jgi:hypothetical protein
MPHHLVLRDKMELLKLAQGDGIGSLASYVQNLNQMLIMVPLKKEYTKKLIFLHNSKPWGPKNCLSKDRHPKHLSRFDEGGGVHRKQWPFMPQG